MTTHCRIERDFPETVLEHTNGAISGTIASRWVWDLADPFAITVTYGITSDGDLYENSQTWTYSAESIKWAIAGIPTARLIYSAFTMDDEMMIAMVSPDPGHVSTASFPRHEVADFIDSVNMLDDPEHYNIDAAVDDLLEKIFSHGSTS